jgi:hypothetical protein
MPSPSQTTDRTADPVESDKGLDPTAATGDGGGEDRIKCPVCRWTPAAHDRWMCNCGHLWNTFDTGGVCPNCLLKWAYTACPACQLFSPHSDWYVKL